MFSTSVDQHETNTIPSHETLKPPVASKSMVLHDTLVLEVMIKWYNLELATKTSEIRIYLISNRPRPVRFDS